MVGKLIKHDFISSARYYVPVFAVIFIGTLLLSLNILFGLYLSDIIVGLIGFVSMLLILAALVLSVRASLSLLYINIYNKNAYSLFTLPIKSWQIVVAKLVVATLWSIAVLISLFVCLFTLLQVAGALEIFTAQIELIISSIKLIPNLPTLLVYLTLSTLISSVYSLLLVLLAGSLANSSFIMKARAATAVGFFFLIDYGIGMIKAPFSDYFTIEYLASTTTLDFSHVVYPPLFLGLFFNVLLCALFFYLITWLWNNKLEIIN